MKPQWLWNERQKSYFFYYFSDEVDAEIKRLRSALKSIDSLSEEHGSSTGWKEIYEEAQAIARKILEEK
jgi:hypothetical protein